MIHRLCTLLLLPFLLTACDPAPEPLESAPVKLQARSLLLQLNSPDNSAEHEAAQLLAIKIDEKTQGEVAVRVQRSENTNDERQLLANLQAGELDFAIISTAKASHLVNQLELFDLPFVMENAQQMQALYDSKIAKGLLEQLRDDDLIGLAYWYAGAKQLVTDFPLNDIRDFSQRRFKVLESTMLKQQFQQWGAASIAIAETRIKEAFAENLIDGEEDTAAHIAQHIDNQQTYLTYHGQQTLLLLMSAASYAALSPEHQKAIQSAVSEVSEWQFAQSVIKDREAIATLKSKGLATDPSEALIADMRKAHQNLLEKNRTEMGTGFVETYLQLRENWQAPHPDKLIVALDADLTGSAAKSGLAIRRGIELALDEINKAGGLLGKEVALVARDNTMVPARGLDNIELFSTYPNLLAVFSGISSPVVLQELDFLHQARILMLVPWAAATPIVSNGYTPNYVFRVSVRDEYAAQFMIDGALTVSDDIGFLLVNNGWGRSNYSSLMETMNRKQLTPVHTEWFDWGEQEIKQKVNTLISKQVKALIFVGNAVEGEKFIKALSEYPNPPVVFSHWGITGSTFGSKTAKAREKVDLRVLQTFSFINNPSPLASSLVKRYHQKYHTETVQQIFAPSGTAHAYDLMKMLAIATQRAGEANMSAIRAELEKLDHYEGLMKTYQFPFKNAPQDALQSADYMFAFYKDNVLYPMEHVNAD